MNGADKDGAEENDMLIVDLLEEDEEEVEEVEEEVVEEMEEEVVSVDDVPKIELSPYSGPSEKKFQRAVNLVDKRTKEKPRRVHARLCVANSMTGSMENSREEREVKQSC